MRFRGVRATATLVAVVGVVATGCSGPAAPRSQAPSAAGTPVATFTPDLPSASTLQLSEDAKVLTSRLRTLGDRRASAVVRGRTVEVLGGGGLPVPVGDLTAMGVFQIRPALCASGPYTPSPSTATAGWPSSCSAGRYSLEEPNLTVDTSTGVSNLPSIQPDPALSSYESRPPAYDDSHPDGTVLVPATDAADDDRFLLGPAVLNGTAVAHASATSDYSQWTVDVTLTGPGAAGWDAVARKYFHEMLAVDVDGKALSVPLTEPNQSAFAGFGGKVQISGNFTKQSAEQLAAVLESGPLAAPLSG